MAAIAAVAWTMAPPPAAGQSTGGGVSASNSPYASSPLSDGSASNPHIILTLAQFDNVRLDPDAHYVQPADIDASGTWVTSGPDPWNRPEGFEPLGSVADPFTGVYDGGGFAIRNLRMHHPGGSHIALFAATDSATIRNLALDGLQVTGGSVVGGVLARGNLTTLDHVYVRGQIRVDAGEGDAGKTGGIAASLDWSSLTNCSFRGPIRLVKLGNVLGSTGGLVGFMGSSCCISDSYVRVSIEDQTTVPIGMMEYDSGIGAVAGSMLRWGCIERTWAIEPTIVLDSGGVFGLGVGGVVGNSTLSEVIDSRSFRGHLDAPQFEGVGGVAGMTYGSAYARCWSSTEIRSSGYGAGGFLGFSNQHNVVRDSYATGDVLETRGGGFVGALEEPGLDVSNSYASGDVPSGYGFFGQESMNDAEDPRRFFLTNVFCIGQSGGFGPGCGTPELCSFLNYFDGTMQDFHGEAHAVYAGPGGWDFTATWQSREDALPALRYDDSPSGFTLFSKGPVAPGVQSKTKRTLQGRNGK